MQLLLASDEALSWERLYSEAVVKVVARSTPQKAASASPPLPEQSVEAAAAAADDDDTNPLTALVSLFFIMLLYRLCSSFYDLFSRATLSRWTLLLMQGSPY